MHPVTCIQASARLSDCLPATRLERARGIMSINDRVNLSECLENLPKWNVDKTQFRINTKCRACNATIKITKAVVANGACKTTEAAEDAVWRLSVDAHSNVNK